MKDVISKLDRPEERVALLKAGFSGKEIEELYIERNGIRIVDGNLCHS